jgi:hypothetical protein
MAVWDRIVVEVEADIGRLADRDRDAFQQRCRVVRQSQQSRRFVGEYLADSALGFVRAAPVGGRTVAPVVGLGVQIVETGEAAGGEECVTHIADGSFHAALLVAAPDRDGPEFVTVVPGKTQQCRVEPDRLATAFQHRALQIVVQQDTRDAIPRGKGGDMATQEVLHPGVREEAQEDLARVAEHHDERISGRRARPILGSSPRTSLEMAEMSPIDLSLLAGQAAQAQISLGLRTRPMAADEMAEVIGAAAIAAFAHHHIQPACRQRREALQRLADECKVGVDLRLARGRAGPRQTGLRQHPANHAVMHVQLLGDGADQRLLRVVEAQYPRFDLRWRHHGRVPSGRVVAPIGETRGDARTLDGRDPDSAARTNHSASKAAGLGLRRPLRRSRSPASRRTANHPAAMKVNRDASHSCIGPGSGVIAQRARAVLGGWSGSVDPRRA